PTPQDDLRLMVYGSGDRARVFQEGGTGPDPSLRGDAGLKTRFHFSQLTWKHRYNDRIHHEVNFAVGPTKLDLNIVEGLYFHGEFIETSLRAEWRFQLAEHVALIVGTDTRVIPFDVRYGGPRPGQTEGGAPQGPIASQEEV